VTRVIDLDVYIFARFTANCEVMPLHSFANFKLVMSRHRKKLHGALGHGLCVNLPLTIEGTFCNQLYQHGRNLVGETGDVSLHFFRWGDIISHVLHFFSSDFIFAEVSKVNVTFVTFCVKSFSC